MFCVRLNNFDILFKVTVVLESNVFCADFLCLVHIHGRGLCLDDFIYLKKKESEKVDAGMCSDVCRLISNKLVMMVDSTKLYSLVTLTVKVTLTFIQGHSCTRKQ